MRHVGAVVGVFGVGLPACVEQRRDAPGPGIRLLPPGSPLGPLYLIVDKFVNAAADRIVGEVLRVAAGVDRVA
jgi:hypothetical protein